MKRCYTIPLLVLILFSCGTPINDLTKEELEFVPTDVFVKTEVGYSIDQVFEFINSFDHDVEYIKYGIYTSSLPSDSLQYVLDYLNTKPYTHDGNRDYVTGYLHYSTKQIKIFPKLFQIKKKEYQTDWLHSIEVLQLAEETDEKVGGHTIFFHVPEGHEKEWEIRFESYDFVEWAELNYYVSIVR